MKRPAFFCAGLNDYVVCPAPLACNHDCSKYRAKRVTGVKVRDRVGLSGYVNGIYLVTIKNSSEVYF